jgi:hypothetical protein
VTPAEEREYQRRLAVREKHRAEVREAAGYSDHSEDEDLRREAQYGSGIHWLGGWTTGS